MYRSDETIYEILDRIAQNEYVLPPIQREFVWKSEQICQFFDSLMQGYPFGTFLFWKIGPKNSETFRYYDFVRNYHQQDRPHCELLPNIKIKNHSLIGVLDGQQRLTALNIGLTGSAAWKLPGKWKRNPYAYPKQFLYLNLLSKAQKNEEEQGALYRFEFMTEAHASSSSSDKHWFKVSDIMGMKNHRTMMDWLRDQPMQREESFAAHDVLEKLRGLVHDNDRLVSYYEEKSQDIERVLHIFIRTNSGGTILSYSDLLLSTAVSQWKMNAREEIHDFVDEINRIGNGFSFTKDFVLKAGLMLSDIGSVGFKVENFNRKNMEILENNWRQIQEAIRIAIQLVSSFGFDGRTIRSASAMLPIAYYLYKLNPE